MSPPLSCSSMAGSFPADNEKPILARREIETESIARLPRASRKNTTVSYASAVPSLRALSKEKNAPMKANPSSEENLMSFESFAVKETGTNSNHAQQDQQKTTHMDSRKQGLLGDGGGPSRSSKSTQSTRREPKLSNDDQKNSRNQVQQLLEKLDDTEQSLKTSLEVAHISAEELRESKQECQGLEDRILDLESQLKDEKDLEAQLAAVKTQLRETQDYVFSLQIRGAKLTESEAIAEYSSLCMAVEELVQTKLGDAIDERKALQVRSFSPLVKQFLALIPQPGRDAFEYPGTDEYNVIAAIIQFLKVDIFDRDLYVPIEDPALGFLQSIETSMRKLEPRRDVITIQTWRSETFAALTQTPQFIIHRQRHSKNLSEHLAAMLHGFMPGSDFQALAIAVRNTVIEPALQLAHKIQLSTDRFKLYNTSSYNLAYDQRNSRDLATHDCVQPSGKVVRFPAPQGVLTYLFDLSPKLLTWTAKVDSYGEGKVLKRARVLIAVTDEQNIPYVGRRPKEIPTLLGLMDQRIRAEEIAERAAEDRAARMAKSYPSAGYFMNRWLG